ncbi:MAG: class I SAM-dependent methyltransferase [Candidatus Obscuribacterales bacterium]|nr:class I SAM-dependent methyltransferase [Candidatus Obscuribacterales bacterium]
MISSTCNPKSSQQFLLDNVAFYGRTFDEYIEMFNFQANDWVGKKVLDCASGPSSFTAEANRNGIHAVACDPRYSELSESLIPLAENDMRKCLAKVGQQVHLFDALADNNKSHYLAEKAHAVFTFSNDYTEGKKEGRYIAASLPELPFADNSFDLVLNAHLLFLYSSKNYGGVFEKDEFSMSFHIQAISELIRVSKWEVRIYPLKGPNSTDNPMLSRVLEVISQDSSLTISLVPVNYKDIAGANLMLRIQKQRS